MKTIYFRISSYLPHSELSASEKKKIDVAFLVFTLIATPLIGYCANLLFTQFRVSDFAQDSTSPLIFSATLIQWISAGVLGFAASMSVAKYVCKTIDSVNLFMTIENRSVWSGDEFPFQQNQTSSPTNLIPFRHASNHSRVQIQALRSPN